jgi:hypothetical protein
MIEQLSVKNFQSLHDVTVNLSGLTVIVGPSSSGKSAFTRALKTLTGNQRGDSFITHGQTQTVITARTDKGTVALLRGKKNEYVIIPADSPEEQRAFTKLNGTTPEEVSEFIGISAKDPLNYANQFDMPYLLTSSAAEVARTLGDLTNVSVIFEASREANRRRLQASSTLKTRAGDYATLTQDLGAFKTLKEDLAMIERAEELVGLGREYETRISRLDSLISAIQDLPDVPPALDLPDLSDVEDRELQISILDHLIEECTAQTLAVEKSDEALPKIRTSVKDLEEEYVKTLKDLGTCPTCGQNTEHAHGLH